MGGGDAAMSNQYRAVHPSLVAIHGAEQFDHEYATPTEEQDALARGRVEIVPRPYRVLSTRYSRPQGEVFEAAFPMEVEAALISGGHLERVRRDAKPSDSASEPARKPPAKRAARSKE